MNGGVVAYAAIAAMVDALSAAVVSVGLFMYSACASAPTGPTAVCASGAFCEKGERHIPSRLKVMIQSVRVLWVNKNVCYLA